LKQNRIATLNRVLQFFGMPSWDWIDADLKDEFVGGASQPIPERARAILREYYQDSNQLLASLLDNAPSFARNDSRLIAV
jgi:hypothetical protein